MESFSDVARLKDKGSYFLLKICRTCQAEKPAFEFGKNRAKCRLCYRAQAKHFPSRAKQRDYARKHSLSDLGKEAKRIRDRRNYWANPSKHRLKQIRHRFDLSDDRILEEVRCRDKVCQLCGTNKDLSFDHVRPASLGFKVETSNDLQLLCRSCNSWKSTNLVLANNAGIMLTRGMDK